MGLWCFNQVPVNTTIKNSLLEYFTTENKENAKFITIQDFLPDNNEHLKSDIKVAEDN